MEDNNTRLAKLLSQERIIRSQVKGLSSSNNNTSSKSSSNEQVLHSKSQYSDIDTSPITTPENIDQTRRRLSRLLVAKQENTNNTMLNRKQTTPFKHLPITSPSLKGNTSKRTDLTQSIRPRETIPLLDKKNNSYNLTSPMRIHSRSLSPISRYNIDRNVYNTHSDIYRNSIILKKSNQVTFNFDNNNNIDDNNNKETQTIVNNYRAIYTQTNNTNSNNLYTQTDNNYNTITTDSQTDNIDDNVILDCDLNIYKLIHENIISCNLKISHINNINELFEEINNIQIILSEIGVELFQLWIFDDNMNQFYTDNPINTNDKAYLDNYYSNIIFNCILQESNNKHNIKINKNKLVWDEFLKILYMFRNYKINSIENFKNCNVINLLPFYNNSNDKLLGVIIYGEIEIKKLPLTFANNIDNNNLSNIREMLLTPTVESIYQVIKFKVIEYQYIDNNNKTQLVINMNELKYLSKDLLLKGSMAMTSIENINELLTTAPQYGCISNNLIINKSWLLLQEIDSNYNINSLYNDYTNFSLFFGHKNEHIINSNFSTERKKKVIDSIFCNSLMKPSLIRIESRDDLIESNLFLSSELDDKINCLSFINVNFSIMLSTDLPSYDMKAGMYRGSLLIAISPEIIDHKEIIISHCQFLSQSIVRAFENIHTKSTMDQSIKFREVPRLLNHLTALDVSDVSNSLTSYTNRLFSVLSGIQNLEIAKLLKTRKTSFLLSDSLVSSINLCEAPSNNRVVTFYGMKESSIVAVSPDPIDITESLWLQELFNGNFIIHNTDDESNPNYCNYVTKSNHSNEQDFITKDRNSLQSLIQSIDSKTKSTILFPVKVYSGLCILVLLDKEEDKNVVMSKVSKELHHKMKKKMSSVTFNNIYAKELISSNIIDDIIYKMNNVCMHFFQYNQMIALENTFENKITQMNENYIESTRSSQSNEVKLEKLFKLLESNRVKKIAQNNFSFWRYKYQQHAALKRELVNSFLIKSIHNLVKFKEISSDTDNVKSFLSIVEHSLYDIFSTTDGVNISIQISDIDSGSGNSVYHAMGNDSILSGTVSYKTANSYDVRNDSDNSAHTEISVLGIVRISKGNKSNRASFESFEKEAFHNFCLIASDIYTSIKRGLYADLVDGNAKSLIFPMLSTLVPVILQSVHNNGDIYSILISWLKKISNAELVLLHLNSASTAENKELLISSDELKDRHGSSSISTDLSKLIDSKYTLTKGSSGISEINQIIINLLDTTNTISPTIIGELKVFGSRKCPFTSEQKTAIDIISYLLVHSLNDIRVSTANKRKENLLHKDIKDLEQSIHNLESKSSTENSNIQHLRTKLNSLSSILAFIIQLGECGDINSLSDCIADIIPKVIRANSAVLLLGNVGRYNDSFRIMLPSKYVDNGSISYAKLQQLPSYFDEPRAIQSKIELISDSIIFGSILVFNSQDCEISNNFRDDKELLTVLLSSVIVNILKSFGIKNDLESMKSNLSHSDILLRNKSSLETEIETLLKLKDSLEFENNNVNLELAETKCNLGNILIEKQEALESLEIELDTLKQKNENMVAVYTERLKVSDDDVHMKKKELEQCVLSKAHISNLLASFLFDQKNHREHIIKWVKNIAFDKNLSLLFIDRLENGNLEGKCDNIRGSMTAISEAIRTGRSVVLATNFLSESSFFDTSLSVRPSIANNFTSTQHTDKNVYILNIDKNHSNKHDSKISVLCVPNRFIGSEVSTEFACFVFVKQILDTETDLFSDFDVELLDNAVNLTCKTLQQSQTKYNEFDFIKLENEIQSNKDIINKLRQVIIYGDQIRFKVYNSKFELGNAIEEAVCQIIAFQNTSLNVVDVDTNIIFSPFDEPTSHSKVILKGFYNIDSNLLHQIIGTNKPVRKGNIMMIPLKRYQGDIIGILRVEKKISYSSSNDCVENTNINSLVFSELDEEAVRFLICQLVSLFDKFDCVANAYDSVHQASQALISIQQSNSSLCDKLSFEVASRLQYEELTKTVVTVLEMANKRVSIEHLFETVRKSVLSITGSKDTVIILPGEINLTGKLSISDNISSIEGSHYYISNLYEIIPVHLDDIDVEMISLKNNKPISLSRDGFINDGYYNSINSWTIRNFDSSTGMPSNDDNSGTGYYLQTIPFGYRSNNILLTMFRKTEEYNSIDKECINYICKLLSYCISIYDSEKIHMTSQLHLTNLITNNEKLEESNNNFQKFEEDIKILMINLNVDYSRLVSEDNSLVSFSKEFESIEKNDNSLLKIILIAVNLVFINNSSDTCMDYYKNSDINTKYGIMLSQESIVKELLGVSKLKLQKDVIDTNFGNIITYSSNPLTDVCFIIKIDECPLVWIKLSSLPMSTVLVFELKVILLRKVIEIQLNWNNKLKIYENKFKDVETMTSTALNKYEAKLKRKIIEVDNIKEMSKNSEELIVQNFQLQLSTQKSLHNIIEQIFFHAMIISKNLQHIKVKDKNELWLQSQIVDISNIYNSLGTLNVSVSIQTNSTVSWLTGNMANKNIITRNDLNPFNISYNNNIVIFLDPIYTRQKELITSIYSEYKFYGCDLLFMTSTELFDNFSFIIPFRLSDESFIMVSSSAESEILFIPLFISFISICSSIKDTMNNFNQYKKILTISQNQAIKIMMKNVEIEKLKRLQCQIVIEKLSNNKILSKNVELKMLEPKLINARDYIKSLERGKADWTELVKGINGASEGINNGFSYFWAESSKTLISVLSSYFSIKGCGLIVQNTNNNDELTEYNVRDLSTSILSNDGSPLNNSKYQNPIIEEGILEVRLLSELGYNIEHLVSSIYNHPSTSQRIYKLSRQKENSVNIEENLWLVPIRNAHSILGIIRVTLYISGSTNTSNVFMQTPPRINSNKSTLDDSIVEEAQNNLINFAEIIAPLLFASKQIESINKSNSLLDVNIRSETTKLYTLSQELSFANEKLSQLVLVVDSLNRISLNSSNSSELTEICDTVSYDLSNLLGKQIDVVLTRSLIESDTLNNDIQVEKDINIVDRNDLYELLLDQYNESFGYVLFRYNEANDRGNNKYDAMILHFLLKYISKSIASILINSARKIRYKHKLSIAFDNINSFEETVQEEKNKIQVLKNKEIELTKIIDFYRGLSDIINKGLLYNTNYSTVPLNLDVSKFKLSESPVMLDLLRNISNSLPLLVTSNCLFSFAVLDTQEASNNINLNGIYNMAWVYGNNWNHIDDSFNIDNIDNNPFFNFPDIREISINLAQVCLNKKVKSSFDIVPNSTDPDAPLNNIRILTYSLINQTNKQVLGIMQVFVNLSSPYEDITSFCEDVCGVVSLTLVKEVFMQSLTNTISLKEVDNIAQEVKLNESDLLREVWQQKASAWRGISLLSTYLIENCYSVTSNESYIDSVMNILSSDIVKSMLSESGLEIQFSTVADVSNKALLSNVSNATGFFYIPLSHSSEKLCEVYFKLVPHIDKKLYSTHADGLKHISNEIIEAVSTILKSIIEINKSKSLQFVDIQKKANIIIQKYGKLKTEFTSNKQKYEELLITTRSTINDLSVYKDVHNILKNHTNNNINSICLPIVKEYNHLTKDIFNIFGNQPFKNEVETVSNTMWEEIVKVADRTVARISKGSFPHHVSVIVRSNDDLNNENIKEDIINVNIYDGININDKPYKLGSTHSDFLFSDKYKNISILEKCFRIGGVVENNTGNLSPNDLVGVNASLLSSIFGNPIDKTMCLLCISPDDNHTHSNRCAAIIRVIYLIDNTFIHSKESGESKAAIDTDNLIESIQNLPNRIMYNMISPMLQIVLGFGISIHNLSTQSFRQIAESTETKVVKKDIKQKLEVMQVSLSRFKKMYRIVCREASSLLDPPIIGPSDGSIPKAIHPASLTPLAASQDICLKLLSMMRTLVRSEGSALVLKDPISHQINNNSNIQTYQVIFSGDSIKWNGINPGTFGMVSSSSLSKKTSLVESVMTTRRGIQVTSAIDDSRYNPNVDGVTAINTPLLYVPLRGRGGSVVGVLIVSKGATETESTESRFSVEDIAAAEISCSFGALSLYWCQGLGTIHHKLNKYINKIDKLEQNINK